MVLVIFQAVGAAAKQGIIRNAQNSVCHVKQVLGRTFDDAFVTDYKRKSAVTVSQNWRKKRKTKLHFRKQENVNSFGFGSNGIGETIAENLSVWK